MLTRKQVQLLEFIHKRVQRDGVPPSFDEMKDALDLRSKSGIHRLITALEERGFIRRLAHRARAIEIVRLPDAMDGAGFVPTVIEGDADRDEAPRQDLAEIAAFINESAGPGIAREALRRLRVRLTLIAQTPGEIGSPRPEIEDGVRSFAVPPHVIFFRYSGERVEVARILHERQDIERVFFD